MSIENQSQQRDELFDSVVAFVVKTQKCSTAILQREFKLGYLRAVRIMNQLEEAGVVAACEGFVYREVLKKK